MLFVFVAYFQSAPNALGIFCLKLSDIRIFHQFFFMAWGSQNKKKHQTIQIQRIWNIWYIII